MMVVLRAEEEEDGRIVSLLVLLLFESSSSSSLIFFFVSTMANDGSFGSVSVSFWFSCSDGDSDNTAAAPPAADGGSFLRSALPSLWGRSITNGGGDVFSLL